MKILLADALTDVPAQLGCVSAQGVVEDPAASFRRLYEAVAAELRVVFRAESSRPMQLRWERYR